MLRIFVFLMMLTVGLTATAQMTGAKKPDHHSKFRGFRYTCWAFDKKATPFVGTARSFSRDTARDNASTKALTKCVENGVGFCGIETCTYRIIRK
jgi:hypothetical protein